MRISRRFLSATALALLFAAGASRASAPAGRYSTVSGSGIVSDTKTKLTWQQAVPQTASYTWGSATTSGTAQSYCANLSSNGTGWRLPTIGELQTLVDYSQAASPKIDPIFSNTPANFFWSSTPVAGSPSSAWHVDFANGIANNSDVGTMDYVRCVR